MIKISDQELYCTISLLKIIERCRFSHRCLWFERKDLPFTFQESTFRPCLKDNCPIVVFRKKLESESPLFYAQALELCQVRNILKRAVKIFEMKHGSNRQRRRRYLRRLEEIKNFDYLFIMAIYPLSLKMAEAPLLRYEKLVELTDIYNSSDRLQIIEEMTEVNYEWFTSIYDMARYLTSDSDHYSSNIFYLAYLYIKGLERDELPDLKNMPPRRKDEFFQEINREISPTIKILKLIRVLRAIWFKKSKTD